MPICQNCGKLNKDSSKYCAEWGSKIVTDNIQHDYSEEYNPAYGKLTRKMENRLNNSNLFDKFIDKVIQVTPVYATMILWEYFMNLVVCTLNI